MCNDLPTDKAGGGAIDELTVITCQWCGVRFYLHEAPGVAGVAADGQFSGRCPRCNTRHNEGIMAAGTYSDAEVENIVIGLEIAGDNLWQRVLELLWQRHWQAGLSGVMQ